MKSRLSTHLVALTFLAVLATPLQVMAQHLGGKVPRYRVTDLGTLGGTFSQAFGVNNKGSVVGYATLPGDTIPGCSRNYVGSVHASDYVSHLKSNCSLAKLGLG